MKTDLIPPVFIGKRLRVGRQTRIADESWVTTLRAVDEYDVPSPLPVVQLAGDAVVVLGASAYASPDERCVNGITVQSEEMLSSSVHYMVVAPKLQPQGTS